MANLKLDSSDPLLKRMLRLPLGDEDKNIEEGSDELPGDYPEIDDVTCDCGIIDDQEEFEFCIDLGCENYF